MMTFYMNEFFVFPEEKNVDIIKHSSDFNRHELLTISVCFTSE